MNTLLCEILTLTGYCNPPLIGTCISNPKIVSSNENLSSPSQFITSAHFNRNKNRHNSHIHVTGGGGFVLYDLNFPKNNSRLMKTFFSAIVLTVSP